ncbi:MAG: 50S ribosomal protein L24 [Methylococcaceae bacterium]|nr:50S ribosomal protein L24 [Methylococcaceae bacterium]
MRKIRKGDQAIVIAGRDKGKRGTVLSVNDDDTVLVEGINMVKKHQKPIPARNITGGITDKAMPIAISNIAIFNPAINKGDRVGFRLLADGRKVRFFKSTNDVVDA